MTTSSILASAWAALEDEPEKLFGLYERRVFADSGFAVFVGLLRPANYLRLSLIVPSTVGTEGLERETRGFSVRRHYTPADRSTRVSLELGASTFRELFVIMAEDVAARVLATSDEEAAVSAMRERLDHWERFMRTSGVDGLSREDQIGLFGELTFLKTALSAGIPAATAVSAWMGPGGANQDFQFRGRALEVKASTANSSTTVHISNELQLDETDCEQLFLFHLWMREQTGSGTTLPALVGEVMAMLSGAPEQHYADQLVRAGYHDVHRALYEETGYVERGRHYYAVKGVFPRVRSGDLRPGVSKVSYRIDVAGFATLQRHEVDVIQSLLGSQP